MPRKTILIAAPAVGALLIGWAAFAARPDPGSAPAPRPAPVGRKSAAPAAAFEGPAPSATRQARPDAAPPSSPETAVIQERVRKMEERLQELEARRDALTADNQDLQKQVTEKWAEASARSTAEWRVKSWEAMLGLNESQKQSLTALWTKWAREDAGRPAGRESWGPREAELRAQLTVEQAAKLHATSAAQAAQMWSMMGRSLGGMVGVTKDEQVRLQQSLGDLRIPGDMLLPEAHGGDWPGLLREASARARPLLTPEQTARLEKFGGNK